MRKGKIDRSCVLVIKLRLLHYGFFIDDIIQMIQISNSSLEKLGLNEEILQDFGITYDDLISKQMIDEV